MPVIEIGGDLNIVAHQDDDLLFMNPDILHSIEAGTPVTTVYLTAGDAGLGQAYWDGREEGVKAAYALMADSDAPWVDETVTLTLPGGDFSISSSYLSDDPDIRLYFLRLPDGAGLLSDEEAQSLARLASGALPEVATVDAQHSYAREDLVDLLTAVMDLHAPTQFRLQIDTGPYASGEHTDHIATAYFSEAALADYQGSDYTVTSYVNYQSSGLVPNLEAQDAARALEIMERYAEYDPGVWDEEGGLHPTYAAWTQRQYVAEEYVVGAPDPEVATDPPDDMPPDVDPAEDPPSDPVAGPTPIPAPPDLPAIAYGLDGPDAFLFEIDPATGEISTKDWFTPSLDDAWDQDEDYIYELTRVILPATGGEAIRQEIRLDTLAEGVLSAEADSPPPDPDLPDVDVLDPDLPDVDPPADDTPDDDPQMDAPADPPSDVPDTPETPAQDPQPDMSGAYVYGLTGPDALLFAIDSNTGAITPKDWFIPSYDDAWDVDENHIYDVTRIAQPLDGGEAQYHDLRFEVTPQDVLQPLSEGAGLMADLAEQYLPVDLSVDRSEDESEAQLDMVL
jgi:LmbE family N-acetylglucosaminyl deacetylase